MRRQRTLLQHEVDILTQSMNQELLTLNDNVRAMFNDRRIAVREEQKAVESTVSSLVTLGPRSTLNSGLTMPTPKHRFKKLGTRLAYR